MTSQTATFDICVAGGGPAGMIAALAFGTAGLHVLCVDPVAGPQGNDRRSTAFMQPAQTFLDRIGLWPRLAPDASPLQIMRIVDAGGPGSEPRRIRDFDAAEIGDLPFGWNLPNCLIRQALAEELVNLPNITHRTGVGVTDILTRTGEARVTLSDGTRIRARLVVAADGRNSGIRAGAGIGVRTTRFGQRALAFSVTHPEPHENISTEIHRSGGPFTLVPLPDADGLHASAVVWMEHASEANRLAALPETDFNAAITERSCGLLGDLTLRSERGSYPIISQTADRIVAERIALIAEAAHVVPPIGAQGLNMSLADIACLHDLAVADPTNLGTTDMLGRYQRNRLTEIRARVAAVGVLNRASMVDAQALRDLRMRALDAMFAAGPVKRTLMRKGMGALSR